jgi:hypothetical protein
MYIKYLVKNMFLIRKQKIKDPNDKSHYVTRDRPINEPCTHGGDSFTVHVGPNEPGKR